jgi:hypothetical protein
MALQNLHNDLPKSSQKKKKRFTQVLPHKPQIISLSPHLFKIPLANHFIKICPQSLEDFSYFFPSQKLSHILLSSYPTKPPKTHKNKNIIDFILFLFFSVVEAHYSNPAQSKRPSPKNN